MYSKYVSIAGSNLLVYSSMKTMYLEVGGFSFNLIDTDSPISEHIFMSNSFSQLFT